MMYWEGINQRKFPRAEYRCKVGVIDKNSGPAIETYTENIGSGGICVVLDNPFELFDDVSLEIFIGDDGTSIVCTGTVVWVVKRHNDQRLQKVSFDTGIEFLNISQQDKKRIVKLVEKILSGTA